VIFDPARWCSAATWVHRALLASSDSRRDPVLPGRHQRLAHGHYARGGVAFLDGRRAAAPTFGRLSDGLAEFVEGVGQAKLRGQAGGELVVAAAQILDEPVSSAGSVPYRWPRCCATSPSRASARTGAAA